MPPMEFPFVDGTGEFTAYCQTDAGNIGIGVYWNDGQDRCYVSGVMNRDTAAELGHYLISLAEQES